MAPRKKETAAKSEAKAKAAASKAEKKSSAKAQTLLLGSSVQPATFTAPDGKTVQLGFVVAEAARRGGHDAANWNTLTDADREHEIQLVIDALALKPISEEAKPTAKTKAAKSVDTSAIASGFDALESNLAATSSGKQPRQLRWALKSLKMARDAAERYLSTI